MSWGEVWALVITVTGWTFEQVDRTPWPDLVDLLTYWREWPPVHISMRPKDMKTKKAKTEGDKLSTRDEVKLFAARLGSMR